MSFALNLSYALDKWIDDATPGVPRTNKLFAERSGMSANRLAKLRNGRADPTLAELRRLLHELPMLRLVDLTDTDHARFRARLDLRIAPDNMSLPQPIEEGWPQIRQRYDNVITTVGTDCFLFSFFSRSHQKVCNGRLVIGAPSPDGIPIDLTFGEAEEDKYDGRFYALEEYWYMICSPRKKGQRDVCFGIAHLGADLVENGGRGHLVSITRQSGPDGHNIFGSRFLLQPLFTSDHPALDLQEQESLSESQRIFFRDELAGAK